MKPVLIISILFASVISVYYVPMKKDHELGEHICRYEINDTSNIYVKPCEEGKYCQKTVQYTGISNRAINGWEYLYTCQNYTQKLFNLKQLDDACVSNSECDSGLTCRDKKCTLNCGTNRVAYRTDGYWTCTDKYLKEKNYYYYRNFEDSSTPIVGYIPYSKYEGKITFHKSNSNLYEKEIVEIADFASLDDGTFVSDARACKSGYYLYFYPDGSLNDPYTGNDGQKNQLYKMCVSLEEAIRYSDYYCQITYSINNENKTYNFYQYILIYMQDHTINSIEDFVDENCPTNILLENKLYKKYIEAMTDEKRTKCNNLENNNYITCNDDEVTKWYYFYKHPDIYSLYYTDEKDDNYKYVVKHLIQVDYPYYQVGTILNVKYSIILLLLLLSILI